MFYMFSLFFAYVDCGKPQSIQQGDSNFVKTTYGSVVTYSCQDGYILNGQSAMKCDLQDGEPFWNSVPPVCEIKCKTEMLIFTAKC